MTTPEIEIETPPAPEQEKEEKKRRALLLILLLLLLSLCCVGCLFLRYVLKPAPIADILPIPPVQGIPPVYVKMITGVDGPMGVAVSPDAQRIYVTESKGEYLIKVFDRDGKLLFSFSPPGTDKYNRNLTYIAVGQDGRVYVSEHYNKVIDIFDADGNFLDAIIDRDMTLSKFLAAQSGIIHAPGSVFYYDNISKQVFFQAPGAAPKSFPGPARENWAPLGLRFDPNGDLLITNNVPGRHEVLTFPAASINADLSKFAPQFLQFGTEGKENGQLSFPNSVVRDSQGNYYVSDGNNGRISAWSDQRVYKTFFAFGSSEQTLNLPRGMWMRSNDQLLVADAVGSAIRAYDVSGTEPVWLYNFGEFGISEGYLNFPVDVCLDSTGRVYIADRENNRIDIWSY